MQTFRSKYSKAKKFKSWKQGLEYLKIYFFLKPRNFFSSGREEKLKNIYVHADQLENNNMKSWCNRREDWNYRY